jgi:hypothetical protein
MHESDLNFAAFIASRNVPAVKRERFVPRVAVTLAREYDNTTAKNLLVIRAEVKRLEQAA